MKGRLVIFFTCLLFTLGHCQNTKPKNCTFAGYFCQDCSTRVLCVQIGETFDKTPIEKCKSPSKCASNQCTTDVDPVCDRLVDLPFVCSSVGIFPHPFYCDQYVFCIPTGISSRFNAVVTTCEDGYGYNALSTECDIDLEGKGCPYDDLPVPICGSLGEIKAHPKNPILYYICQKHPQGTTGLYPFQKLCPNGRKYDDFKCVSHKIDDQI